jgi:hypothetical protein
VRAEALSLEELREMFEQVQEREGDAHRMRPSPETKRRQ